MTSKSNPAQEIHWPYQLVMPLARKAQLAFVAAIKAMILIRYHVNKVT